MCTHWENRFSQLNEYMHLLTSESLFEYKTVRSDHFIKHKQTKPAEIRVA